MNKKIPYSDYIFFTEAWCLLAVARFILVFIPFRKIVPLLGQINDVDDSIPKSIYPQIKLEKISLSVLRASSRSPWRAKCFEQALAAKMMLKRRNFVSTIYFGVKKEIESPNKLTAHAWLDCDGFIVTGRKNIQLYSVVSRFKS